MNCLNCGGHVDSTDKFCQHCGHNLINDKNNGDNITTEKIEEHHCPNCHVVVASNDKFCNNCGYHLTHAFNDKNFNHSDEQVESHIADNTNLAQEAKNLFHHTTKSIGKLAGNEEALKLNLRDMFSEVFKRHSKDEADDIFIAGTRSTTPHINNVSKEWGKPWVFSRVFVALAITFIGLWVLFNTFGNLNALPGMIFIGALVVPISGLIFFFESNAFRNISFFEVLKMFFIGGVFSLLTTIILYQFVSFSYEYQIFGIMTVADAFLVGLIEEVGKAIIVIIFINYLHTNKILNGLLIGAAIGAGFAVFETAGYIMNAESVDVQLMNETIVLRAWSALGGHIVWAAMVGAAAVIAKGTYQFKWENIIDKRFLFFFFFAVVLHGIWDTDFTILGSLYLKIIILIVIAWVIIFILMRAGLTQVNKLQQQYIEEREEL
ncbi:PrsW family glutamic-type intramembrane protease [Staphylococcus simiae]|uniref:DZANK-type domain-containing protein n=1 Tax=Staphylococcus simiae CCM 7213 = CCUG 51256 TaxID=911238 RepID=G5JJS0_9STAP|nr:PrsW family glutamic-type intramembrane protease [Staphylococcus simiae]EHJ07577.1 hypothetical protein SS7213T_08647 [Staphylococcus simiae CCM 7213 = CCUG 51256]PNZ14679.1 PrsW family intramembrane metalloprotease [Staphylococcus simiae]SNV55153.1 membrane spanning protein [Staphylococcus simiae]